MCEHKVISIVGGWCQRCKTQPYREVEPAPISGIIEAYIDEDPDSCVQRVEREEDC